MKKILAFMVSLMLILSLAGCGSDEAAPTEDESAAAETYEEIESEETEPSDADEETSDDSDDSGVISPEFKKTMDDYEAWFDHYCDVMKRYQEEPSNMELLTETTELLAEETKIFDEMENMDQSEMNSAELAYYLDVTTRIEKKLLEVADY